MKIRKGIFRKIGKDIKAEWVKYFFLIGLICLFLFSRSFIRMLVLVLLILFGGFFQIYRRFIPVSIGIEFITFVSITTTLAISPFAGITSACIMVFLSHLATSHICKFMFVKMTVYSFACIVVLFLAPLGLVTLGLIASILINVSYLAIGIGIMANPKVFMDIPGNVINVFFNYYLFLTIGSYFMMLLGA
jgi:hypothetical protein